MTQKATITKTARYRYNDKLTHWLMKKKRSPEVIYPIDFHKQPWENSTSTCRRTNKTHPLPLTAQKQLQTD